MPFLYDNVSPLLFSVGASARFPLMEGMREVHHQPKTYSFPPHLGKSPK